MTDESRHDWAHQFTTDRIAAKGTCGDSAAITTSTLPPKFPHLSLALRLVDLALFLQQEHRGSTDSKRAFGVWWGTSTCSTGLFFTVL